LGRKPHIHSLILDRPSADYQQNAADRFSKKTLIGEVTMMIG
jgi:hypothetical protein